MREGSRLDFGMEPTGDLSIVFDRHFTLTRTKRKSETRNPKSETIDHARLQRAQ